MSEHIWLQVQQMCYINHIHLPHLSSSPVSFRVTASCATASFSGYLTGWCHVVCRSGSMQLVLIQRALRAPVSLRLRPAALCVVSLFTVTLIFVNMFFLFCIFTLQRTYVGDGRQIILISLCLCVSSFPLHLSSFR